MKLIIIFLIFIFFSTNAFADDNYKIDNNTVYIDDSKVYLSATPHTSSSSGWVYFNLTSKVYTGNIDACWGFNTSVSRPTKAEVYNPHWINTTTNHEKTFYNPTFYVYTGNNLDYGNFYNTNYKYTITESVVNDNGTTYITSNVAFDSFIKNGDDYTIYWHTRYDNYYLWKDFSSFFSSINHDYEGYDKWYYIKNIPIISNKEYTIRAWIDIPVSTEKQTGKYYFAIKPSGETISQAINNGHFYNLDPWWNATWDRRKEIILTGGASGAQTDYQLLLNVSYETGMQSDFDDLRFCNETHKLDSWLESKIDSSYALVWVEFPTTPANGIEQTYYIYYGKVVANYWDGAATFLQYHGVASSNFMDAAVVPSTNIAFEAKVQTIATHNVYWGLANNAVAADDVIGIQSFSTTNLRYGVCGNEGAVSKTQEAPYIGTVSRKLRLNCDGTTAYYYVDDDQIGTSVTTNLPNENMGLWMHAFSGTSTQDWSFARKYAANPATYQFGAEQFYAGSIHHNTGTQYNHTIESDGTITANRSITTTDDINWTAATVSDDCQFLVTEYNLTNTTIANFTLYNASLNWLKVTNLTVGVEYRLTNNTVYESHTTDVNGEINFTNNLIPDDYQITIESMPVNITCYSVYPETLYTNYTGLLSGSFIVESNYPLNYSSLAFLMGTNYTLTDDYHSYLKVPANSIASDGIYRAHRRNVTPYLSWENNDTITEGNVYKWGGGDNDSFWISKETINDTHTWINITGVASNVFPSMYYLGRLAIYEAPKTEVEINKGQGVIFKFWNLESLRARDYDYWVRMFFDTQIETTPSDKIDIWYCNNSFDPTSDDPVTCEYCQRLDTWSSIRWLDHEDYQPHNNVSYSKPLIYYAGEPLTIYPDDINYVYLTSETVSSKSYILNTTNSDPEICNLTYAETQTMWLRNEIAGTNTPYAYTPSFFMVTVRDYLEFTHHLYIANDQNVWGHSEYCTVPIGISNVPPTYCRYNYFWWNDITDYNMSGSYTQDFWINLTYGLDPDNGAPLTHILSLYDEDYNFIAFINDSLEGNNTDVDIYFDINDYRSSFRKYRFKIVSTDNEGSTSFTWSPIFELPTDNKFYQTINIIKNFPSTISNILLSFLSYLPLFVGILIIGFLIMVCVGVFSELKQW